MSPENLLQADLVAVKWLLPASYTVVAGSQSRSIHCTSPMGMSDECFKRTMDDLVDRFGERFSEVFHNVCHQHTDFLIYLR